MSSESSEKLARAPHERAELLDIPFVDRRRGDDLLREHVDRVARVAHLLDEPFLHAAYDGGALEQVAAILREDLSGARLADLVTGAPDALHSPRDRTRRLDEHDQVDTAHVDPELEAARRDDRTQAAGFEIRLDDEPLLARQGSMVRAHQFLAGKVVEMRGEPFRHAARVAEDQRGVVLTDQFHEPGVDVRPDARSRFGSTGRWARRRVAPGSARARPCRRPGRRPRAAAPCASRRRRS